MIVYNGGNITNLIKYLGNTEIYVTDTKARAIRYANAQATEEVNPDMNQRLEEGAMILEIETESIRWFRRGKNHTSLDTCEAILMNGNFTIRKVVVRFCRNHRTLYGTRYTGYKDRQQVIDFIQSHGIEIEEV